MYTKAKGPGRISAFVILFTVIFLFAGIFISCGSGDPPEYVTFYFSGLDANDIYLVKVNKSTDLVRAGHTGASRNAYPDDQYNFYLPERTFITMNHPAATHFNANPPPLREEPSRTSPSVFYASSIGDKKEFWIETSMDSGRFTKREATLLAAGTHSNIWVMDNLITPSQASAMAAKFDIIYPLATNILGNEYGKDPSQELNGRDGDPKIQILVYNIGGYVAGFFWGKDYFTQQELEFHGAGNLRTNNAEIFYIDARHVQEHPFFIYSTLAHELQHMIHFNQKTIKRDLNSPTWYNEMLSLMTEDVIAPFIFDSPLHEDHPLQVRMPWFLTTYNLVGITEWNTSSGNHINASYEKAFAFGAYLMRNYGGVVLLQNILANEFVDVQSLSNALLGTTHAHTGITFDQAFYNFAQAMINSDIPVPDDNRLSFNRTSTTAINGTTYTLSSIDIWNMERQGGHGPFIFDVVPTNMAPHSIIIQQKSAWRKISGDFSISLDKPRNENIELVPLYR